MDDSFLESHLKEALDQNNLNDIFRIIVHQKFPMEKELLDDSGIPFSILGYAIMINSSLDIIECLLRLKIKPYNLSSFYSDFFVLGFYPFQKINILELLIHYGYDINRQYQKRILGKNYHLCPLLEAAMLYETKIFAKLLYLGADPFIIISPINYCLNEILNANIFHLNEMHCLKYKIIRMLDILRLYQHNSKCKNTSLLELCLQEI